MYNEFYGLTESPFNMTPDSKYFFASGKHRAALDSVFYVITERKGFTVITGEVGSGKTTVCRTLLNRLDVRTKFAIIRNTLITPKELIALTLEDLEVDYKPGTKAKLISQLNEFLVEQMAQDYNIVLIIDEAQNLSFRALEEVRMLSNLETEREKLIQVVLFGQPQLREKLKTKELEQLRQRIAVYYHLQPLDKSETYQYIQHRMKVAGAKDEKIFSPASVNAVYRYSKGVPRLINLICDNSLISGYADNVSHLTDDLVENVAHSTLLKENFLYDNDGEDRAEEELKAVTVTVEDNPIKESEENSTDVPEEDAVVETNTVDEADEVEATDEEYRETVLSLNAPFADSVTVAGDFNGWEKEPMDRNDRGVWEKAYVLKPGNYQYRFMVDNEWFESPQMQELVVNEFGTRNGVLKV